VWFASAEVRCPANKVEGLHPPPLYLVCFLSPCLVEYDHRSLFHLHVRQVMSPSAFRCATLLIVPLSVLHHRFIVYITGLLLFSCLFNSLCRLPLVMMVDPSIKDLMTDFRDIYWHPLATFPKLTRDNFPEWRIRIERHLRQLDLWEIIEGSETWLELLPEGSTAAQQRAWKVKNKEFYKRNYHAALIISNACSASVYHHIYALYETNEIGVKLNKEVNAASNAAGRTQLYIQFLNTVPVPRRPLEEWYSKLLALKRRLENTPEAISYVVFRSQLRNHLPPILKFYYDICELKGTSIEGTIDILINKEKALALQTPKPAALTVVFYTNQGGRSQAQENRDKGSPAEDVEDPSVRSARS
jgi:hypothetical protein